MQPSKEEQSREASGAQTSEEPLDPGHDEVPASELVEDIESQHTEEVNDISNVEESIVPIKQELAEDLSQEAPMTTVTDIDGNIQDANNMNTLPAPTRIKINITKTVLPGNIVKPIIETIDDKSSSPIPLELKDTKNVGSETNGETESNMNQPKAVKPLIASKKMTHYPPLNKGKDMSALCSIM